MKTKLIIFQLTLAATAFVFSQCGNKKEATEEHEHHAEAAAAEEEVATSKPQFEVDAGFQQQLAGVFKSYIVLKDAFVSSDAKKVTGEATATKNALAGVDMKLLTGAPHHDWMTYLSGMESSLKEMEAATDLAAQRKAFSALSDNLYKSIKAFGLGGETAFYDFCPMAFDNQGGFWLSNEDKIRNPYFGDEMLTCGEVREKLQ